MEYRKFNWIHKITWAFIVSLLFKILHIKLNSMEIIRKLFMKNIAHSYRNGTTLFLILIKMKNYYIYNYMKFDLISTHLMALRYKDQSLKLRKILKLFSQWSFTKIKDLKNCLIYAFDISHFYSYSFKCG